jgi:hypothetical protein
MNSFITDNIQLDNISFDKNAKKKEYIKQWRARNRDKVNNYSLKGYIKKIAENPEYRNVLKERTKQRKLKEKIANGEETTRPRGRPRKFPKKETTEKQELGRPRKY